MTDTKENSFIYTNLKEMKDNQIYVALETPDGTHLPSFSRHDFKFHVDSVTGKTYFIDGGPMIANRGYNRYSANGDEKLFSIYFDDPIETIREHFRWGNNIDKDGRRLPHTNWIRLKDINNDHLDILCSWFTEDQAHPFILLFLREKQYRNEHEL